MCNQSWYPQKVSLKEAQEVVERHRLLENELAHAKDILIDLGNGSNIEIHLDYIGRQTPYIPEIGEFLISLYKLKISGLEQQIREM